MTSLERLLECILSQQADQGRADLVDVFVSKATSLYQAAENVGCNDLISTLIMNTTHRDYWFPAKRHGWGWSLPNTWQGWLVIFVYVAVVGALVYFVIPSGRPLLFYCCLVIATALLALTFFLKGEPPNWHW